MSPKSLWSKKVGSRGSTVVVFEQTAGGMLFVRWWDPTAPGARASGGQGNYRVRSLKHRDKRLGERQALELAAELVMADNASRTGRITLYALLERYHRDVGRHKKGEQPAEDDRRRDIWNAFLGAREAADVTTTDIDRFVRARRAGTIKIADRKLRKNPSDATIGADIVFLESVYNWAVRARLLAESPIRGFERPRAKNRLRPRVDHARFEKVRMHAERVDAQRLFGSFLELVEELGWRVTAICQLRARDLDLQAAKHSPHGRIFKRGDVDKEGASGWIPLSELARKAVNRVLERNPVVGESPLFPSPKDRKRPWRRWHARDLLERAEKAAGLAHVEGGDFHPYRRKWASERKHMPAQDVAAAGGWRDLRSLQNAYQQADEETLLEVMTQPRRIG